MNIEFFFDTATRIALKSEIYTITGNKFIYLLYYIYIYFCVYNLSLIYAEAIFTQFVPPMCWCSS